MQTCQDLQQRYTQQAEELRTARQSLAAAAKQRLLAVRESAADLSGADVMFGTPQTLLRYVQAAKYYKQAVKVANRAIKSHVFHQEVADDSDGDADAAEDAAAYSDADSDGDEQTQQVNDGAAAAEVERDSDPLSQLSSSGSSSDDAELIDLSQVYWFVADDVGLHDTVQQQQSEASDTQLRIQQDAWFEHLQEVASLLPRAELLCEFYTLAVASDIEMSRAARMVYLAEVRALMGFHGYYIAKARQCRIFGECLSHVSTFATTRVALPTGVEPG
jgi:hypothetical protein